MSLKIMYYLLAAVMLLSITITTTLELPVPVHIPNRSPIAGPRFMLDDAGTGGCPLWGTGCKVAAVVGLLASGTVSKSKALASVLYLLNPQGSNPVGQPFSSRAFCT